MLHNDFDLQKKTKELVTSQSLSEFGWVSLRKPLTFAHYQSWLENKMFADMNYLMEHAPQKENPELLLPQAKSALVVRCDYVPHPAAPPPTFAHFESELFTKHLIAKYAQGNDYHLFFKVKLQAIAGELKILFPNHEFKVFTDSHPVLERDLAHQAGLGWFGKNTCLIDQNRGSLFFIGEIYSTLALDSSDIPLTPTFAHPPEPEPQPDRCGTCTRCIDACPTQALEAPHILNANKCISYWTIEAKQNPPENLRKKIGEMYFGCDICQNICPWNEKAIGKELFKKPYENPELLTKDLKKILNSSYKQLEKIFAGTALLRARGWGHKKNAILVAVHYQLKALLPEILKLKQEPRLQDLAAWAEKELS